MIPTRTEEFLGEVKPGSAVLHLLKTGHEDEQIIELIKFLAVSGIDRV